MNTKKLLAALTAVICSTGLITAAPASVNAEEAVHNDFEVNYDGWHENSDTVTVKAEKGKGFDNSRGMVVSGREKAEDGAASSKGFYLSGGISYDYSFKVRSETDETFHVSLTVLDEKTDKETKIDLIDQRAEAGVWTEISAEYKAPAGTYEYLLDITTDSTADFAFDEVVITGKKPSNTVSAASSDKGLKDEFAAYFRVGNILNNGTVKNSAITANVIRDYNSIECENETKPDATLVQSKCSGTEIGVSLSSASAIMDFCVQNNIAMRGHTMVWHSQTPVWFFKEGFNAGGNWVSTTTMDARMESYIKNMFNAIKTQYPDLNLYAYDICNECVSDDQSRTANNGGARYPGDNNIEGGKSAWVQVYGDNSFVEKAFTYADKYAPEGCDLYYNDYNEYWDHKRDCIYDMCKKLYQKGLLDGVGMQSHVPGNATGFAGTDSYIQAMKKYLSIGCDVQITELDISRLDSSGNVAYSLEDQAAKYKAIFQAAMDWNKNPGSTGRVTAVCIWGPNDANSWLKEGSDALLFDKNNQPKLAYTTLTSMIPESEWGSGADIGGDIEPNEYGWYFHSTFEGDLDSWTARGSGDILTSGRTSYVGDEALLIENRSYAWNGAAKALNTRAFKPGTAYSFSVNVNYFDGPDVDDFAMKLQYTDGEGVTQYKTIAEGKVVRGEWAQLANKSYTIPADASNMQIYVETAETTNNFYIDEAIGAVDGTTILGAGEAVLPDPVLPVTKGDLNSDEKVNVIDLALLKAGLINKGFATSSQEEAADINEDGTVDVSDAVQLQKWILKLITKFEVVEKKIDYSAMESLFSNVSLNSSYKKKGENNPLYTQRFGADPGVMEYNGRVYVYMTDDVIEYDSNGNVGENTYGLIQKINCISSDDMVNWTDHGAIEVAGSNGVAKWAVNSWAPCAAHKTIDGKEKFFLYFCNGGNGIGVLTADSPTGPWSDPLGKALVTRSVPNCSTITWLFDPAVFVDGDGTGYLSFGGGVPKDQDAMPGTSRVVKLGNDMLSLAGDPVTINAPYLFEDSGINKIGNTYYYTYCSNWNTSGNSYGLTSGAIEYMTASNPLGPYTYGGELFANQGKFFGYYGNNHHSIVELNGKHYLFYHSRPVEGAMGIEGNYRSPQVNELPVNGTKLGPVTGTMTGIAQLKTLNPFQTVQAETMSSQSKGISVSGLGDTKVSGSKGDWIKVSGVTGGSAASISLKGSSSKKAVIKVCQGSPDSKALAYIQLEGSEKTVTAPLINSFSSGDLYFVFSDSASVDSWGFEATAPAA